MTRTQLRCNKYKIIIILIITLIIILLIIILLINNTASVSVSALQNIILVNKKPDVFDSNSEAEESKDAVFYSLHFPFGHLDLLSTSSNLLQHFTY